MKRYQSLFGLVFSSLVMASPGSAQIVPDATLPINSQVTPQCSNCLINGGTERGVNLFHSFQDFSIPTGGSAWFNNALHIQNILTRVTGRNASQIDGLIRTNGTANFFLLNPNGIVFGPHARLQVGGSFLASTAQSFTFPDGSQFSATQPQAPPLLTVNVTPGLQYGQYTGATIANRASLTAPQDLTLAADQLDVQGQLQAGQHLTLQAQNTVTVRDRVDAPFIAAAGGNLLVQGNQAIDIVALNHPESGFFSRGDMVLRSAQPVNGDAHYWTGGSFRIEQLDGQPGQLVSLYDPVIRSQGDVSFFGYQGASLHILSGGQVTIDTVIITGPDTLANSINPTTTPTLANITLSDGTPLVINGNAQPTLDIRAGMDTAAIAPPLGTVGGGSFFDANLFLTPAPPNNPVQTSANITIGDIVITPPNGLVYLSTQYAPNLALPGGDITVTGTGAFGFNGIDATGIGGNGSSVILDARRTITTASITTDSDTANSGSIRLLSPNGAIDASAAILSTATSTFTAGNGGDIVLRAGGNINAFQLQSDGGLGGSGAITLDSTAGTVTIQDNFGFLGSIVSTTYGNAPAGDIRLSGQAIAIRNSSLNASTQGQANSGQIVMTAPVVDIASSDIFSLVAPGGVGDSGGIRIDTNALRVTGFSELNSSVTANGTGRAGDVVINAPGGSVIFDGGFARSRLERDGRGEGGDIRITTGSFLATGVLGNTTGQLTTATFGEGPAGDVRINATGEVRFDGQGSDIFALVAFDRGVGNAGQVDIQANRLVVANGARLLSITEAEGNSGDIQVRADTIALSNSALISTASSTRFAAGNITLNSRTFTATGGSTVSSEATGGGTAGSVTLGSSATPLEQVDLINSRISSATFGNSGNGGNVAIYGRTVNMADGARVSASTNGTGNAGIVTLGSADAVTIAGQSAIVSETSGSGIAGGINLATRQLTMTEQSTVSASTRSNNSSARGGDLNVQAAQIQLAGNSSLSADTQGAAPGGNVVLQPFGANSLDITFQGNSRISASSTGSGRGGTVTATAPNAITLSGDGAIATETSGSGAAGNVNLATRQLALSNGAAISASSRAADPTANGGDLNVQAAQIRLTGNSSLSADTQGAAPGGNVVLQPFGANSLDIAFQGNSRISASSTGSGRGGTVTATAPNAITLSGDGAIATETSGSGAAGNINLATRQLALSNGAAISASSRAADPTANGGDLNVQAAQIQLAGNSSLSADTQGAAPGGNVVLQPFGANSLDITFQGNSRISASSTGSGRGGTVTATAPNAITLSGDGAIAAETSGNGAGGNLSLTTSKLTVRDRAQASVSGRGNGAGGNLTVTADSVLLENQGKLIAETAAADGGNILLTARDILLMRHNSLISATAGTSQTGGNGGNITITTPFIIGVLSENSDITANAFTGRGGNITINANAIFGLLIQPRLTPLSDITASSALGISGTITINTLNVDPSRGLAILPTSLADPSSRISTSCGVSGSPGPTKGRFVATGRGGLPTRPDEASAGDRPLVDLTNLVNEPALSSRANPNQTQRQVAAPARSPQQDSVTTIVEAQGWVLGPDGQIQLVTAATPNTHTNWEPQVTCVQPSETPTP